MRPFGTFLAVGILALAAGCGDSSSSGGGYTSPTGRTGTSGGAVCKNQSCAAEETYFSCLAGKCDAQAKSCFGPSYTSGTFAGTCKDYIACNMACPCDSNGTACLAACYLAATTDCGTCLATLLGCQGTSGCGAQPPTCASDAATTKNDSSTVTGTGCVAAQACCTALGTSLGASVAQSCLTGIAGLTDAQCTQAMAAYQTYCP